MAGSPTAQNVFLTVKKHLVHPAAVNNRSKAHLGNLATHSVGLSIRQGSGADSAMRVSRGGSPGTMLAAFTMMASAAFAFTPVSPPLFTPVVRSVAYNTLLPAPRPSRAPGGGGLMDPNSK